ncbi:MAG: hypothetical protein ACREH5_01275 [Candidatus Omnitrophota bacterium]
MRKLIVVFVLVSMALCAAGPVFAVQRGTPEYEKMKEYKRLQREKKNNPSAQPQGEAEGFWAREAKRSGFAGTAAMFGNALTGAVPLDKPNSRKETK